MQTSGPGSTPAFENAMLAAGFHIASVLVWVKPAATMGWQDYRNHYEPILYGWKMGAGRRKVEDRTETTVWEIARDAAASYEHPTQKPVELVGRALRNSTVTGETVLTANGSSTYAWGAGDPLVPTTRSLAATLRVYLDERDRADGWLGLLYALRNWGAHLRYTGRQVNLSAVANTPNNFVDSRTRAVVPGGTTAVLG